jgi:hypothetical protein
MKKHSFEEDEMRRLGLTVVIVAFASILFAQLAHAGDAAEFEKKVKELSSKLKAARKQYSAITEQYNNIRGALERMQTNDPNYRQTYSEWRRVYLEQQKVHKALEDAKNELEREVANFLNSNNREVVETVFKTFYKSSGSNPDISIEQALLTGLRRISDSAALDYMIEELKTSKRDNARKLICEVFADKNEDRFTNALIETLQDRDWEVVIAAAKALAKNRAKAAVEPMISAFERAEDRNNEGAARGMRQSLQEMTGEYMLETARDFRNWWNGSGKENYSETETARPRGLIGKGGPRSTLYGEITSKKVIFVCDVSHSMSARGRVPGEPIDGTGETDRRPETGGGVMGGGKSETEKEKMKLGKQGVEPGYVGMRIDILKIELAHVVMSMLPEDARFNLVTYSTQVQKWKSGLTKASDAYREAALKFVKDMKPLGQTNTYGALETAFDDRSVDTIYFLSDGNPTTGTSIDHSEILAAVKRWNQGRNVIIHTIGLLVGKYGNEDHSRLKKFLQDLASQNGGECRIFEDK